MRTVYTTISAVYTAAAYAAMFVNPVTVIPCNCQGEEGREEVRLKKNVNRSLQRLKEQIKAERAAKRLLRAESSNAKSSKANSSNDTAATAAAATAAAAKVSTVISYQCVLSIECMQVLPSICMLFVVTLCCMLASCYCASQSLSCSHTYTAHRLLTTACAL
jgi:hypothetical protein